MKNQALFSSKDRSKKLKCCLLQFFFGAFRVNIVGNAFAAFRTLLGPGTLICLPNKCLSITEYRMSLERAVL